MDIVSNAVSGVIVVGVDGSDASKEALRWAARQAELTDACLRVITSWHPPVIVYGPVPMPEVDYSVAAGRVLQNTIKEILGDPPRVASTSQVVEGPPAMSLIQSAATADLLVVGSRGHGAFVGMLLGSVASHCVSHAPCPVVVVRHGAEPT
jgi:nucleotide-binding universal stress UspA family protein